MKKLLGLLLVVIVGFTACEGPEGPPGPVNIEYVTYTIDASRWQLIGEPNMPGSYYLYEFDEPLLTSYVYERGTMIGYMYYIEDDYEYQTSLPFIYYDMDLFPDAEKPFSIQYMCDFAPGLVSFKVVFSDFYTAEFAPETTKFRVMYIW